MMAQTRLLKTLFVACMGAIVATSVGCRANADTNSPDQTPRMLSVVGDGEAAEAPDVARIDLGVRVQAPTAAEGTRQVEQQMKQLLARLDQMGIRGKDVQTRNVSVYQAPQPPVIAPRMPADSSAPVGVGGPAAIPPMFEVQNMVSITVRDLDKLGSVMSAATDAGANTVHGVWFEFSDTSALEKRALDRAFEDARAKAEYLAGLAGAELGPVMSVEVNEAGAMPVPMMGRMAADAMPVERGEMSVHQRVVVRYALQ